MPNYTPVQSTVLVNQTEFDVPWGYISTEHVHVFIDNVELTPNFHYTWVNQYKIDIPNAISYGTRLFIERRTPTDTFLVDFTDTATLSDENVQVLNEQVVYACDEVRYLVTQTIQKNQNGVFDAQLKQIINLADGILDTDAATVGQTVTAINDALDQVATLRAEYLALIPQLEAQVQQATDAVAAVEGFSQASATSAQASADSANAASAFTLITAQKAQEALDASLLAEGYATEAETALDTINDLIGDMNDDYLAIDYTTHPTLANSTANSIFRLSDTSVDSPVSGAAFLVTRITTEEAGTVTDYYKAVGINNPAQQYSAMKVGSGLLSAWTDISPTLGSGGGGGGNTNLTTTSTTTSVTIESDTGTDATIPAASITAAGVMTTTQAQELTNSLKFIGSGDYAAGGKKITGIANATASTDVVSKQQLDAAIAGVGGGGGFQGFIPSNVTPFTAATFDWETLPVNTWYSFEDHLFIRQTMSASVGIYGTYTELNYVIKLQPFRFNGIQPQQVEPTRQWAVRYRKSTGGYSLWQTTNFTKQFGVQSPIEFNINWYPSVGRGQIDTTQVGGQDTIDLRPFINPNQFNSEVSDFPLTAILQTQGQFLVSTDTPVGQAGAFAQARQPNTWYSYIFVVERPPFTGYETSNTVENRMLAALRPLVRVLGAVVPYATATNVNLTPPAGSTYLRYIRTPVAFRTDANSRLIPMIGVLQGTLYTTEYVSAFGGTQSGMPETNTPGQLNINLLARQTGLTSAAGTEILLSNILNSTPTQGAYTGGVVQSVKVWANYSDNSTTKPLILRERSGGGADITPRPDKTAQINHTTYPEGVWTDVVTNNSTAFVVPPGAPMVEYNIGIQGFSTRAN